MQEMPQEIGYFIHNKYGGGGGGGSMCVVIIKWMWKPN